MDGCSPSRVLARPLARPSSTLRARLLALVAEAAEQEPSAPEPSPRAASPAAADLLRLVRGARAPPGAATPVGPPHCPRLLPPRRLPRTGAHARAPSPPVAPRRSNTSRTLRSPLPSPRAGRKLLHHQAGSIASSPWVPPPLSLSLCTCRSKEPPPPRTCRERRHGLGSSRFPRSLAPPSPSPSPPPLPRRSSSASPVRTSASPASSETGRRAPAPRVDRASSAWASILQPQVATSSARAARPAASSTHGPRPMVRPPTPFVFFLCWASYSLSAHVMFFSGSANFSIIQSITVLQKTPCTPCI